MSISLEQLTQILAKVGISSSHEEEILTAAESLITPPPTTENSYASEQEIKEDNEELQHDLSEVNCAYESLIEQWFQACTRLDAFSFYFVNLEFQQISHVHLYFQLLFFAKLKENRFLLLLHAWLHWKFDYT